MVGLLWAGKGATSTDGGELLLKDRVTGNGWAGVGSNKLTLAGGQTLEREQQQEKNAVYFIVFSENHSGAPAWLSRLSGEASAFGSGQDPKSWDGASRLVPC